MMLAAHDVDRPESAALASAVRIRPGREAVAAMARGPETGPDGRGQDYPVRAALLLIIFGLTDFALFGLAEWGVADSCGDSPEPCPLAHQVHTNFLTAAAVALVAFAALLAIPRHRARMLLLLAIVLAAGWPALWMFALSDAR
jgi:hypothetical protein